MQACRLTITDVAVRRGDRVLLAGVNFSLTPGQALQLAGPNGVGKSSLIRILAGLTMPFAGTVDRTGAAALVDERPALDPGLPLERALAWWGAMDGVDASAHLEQVGLGRLADIPVRYLSTGQKKRAVLARLLGQGAALWFLDEPLNGLDTRGVALVQDLAARHCAAGGICVIASHQPFLLTGMERRDLGEWAA